MTILDMDYPGYGLSEGPPSEDGCYHAAQLAYDFLRNEQGMSPERIVALGQSLGSGPSTWIAAEKEVAGLVLISPFKSTFQVLTQRQILPFDKFDNLKRMKRVEAPLLLIHGTVDDVVPFAHGETLFAAHLGEKKFVAVEGAGHVDLWSGWQELMVNEVFSFCQQAVSRE